MPIPRYLSTKSRRKRERDICLYCSKPLGRSKTTTVGTNTVHEACAITRQPVQPDASDETV